MSGNRIILADIDRGLQIFDLFANHLLTIPVSGLQDVDVSDEFIYFSNKEGLYRTDKKGIQMDFWKKESIQSFDVELGKLYWGDGKIVHSEDLNSLFR